MDKPRLSLGREYLGNISGKSKNFGKVVAKKVLMSEPIESAVRTALSSERTVENSSGCFTTGRVEIDPYVDNYVPVTEGDEQFAEAVVELPQDNGLNGQSGNGMPLEAGDGHNGPPPQGAAGADAHFEQATGNGHVAASSGPPMGPVQGFAAASTAQSVQNPVYAVVREQPLSLSGAYTHAPSVGTMPGVWSRPPDPLELYALQRMPYSRVGYSPAPAGWMMPAPITAAARTTVTTTVTSSVVYQSSCTDTGGVCNPSRIRSCGSPVPY